MVQVQWCVINCTATLCYLKQYMPRCPQKPIVEAKCSAASRLLVRPRCQRTCEALWGQLSSERNPRWISLYIHIIKYKYQFAIPWWLGVSMPVQPSSTCPLRSVIFQTPGKIYSGPQKQIKTTDWLSRGLSTTYSSLSVKAWEAFLRGPFSSARCAGLAGWPLIKRLNSQCQCQSVPVSAATAAAAAACAATSWVFLLQLLRLPSAWLLHPELHCPSDFDIFLLLLSLHCRFTMSYPIFIYFPDPSIPEVWCWRSWAISLETSPWCCDGAIVPLLVLLFDGMSHDQPQRPNDPWRHHDICDSQGLVLGGIPRRPASHARRKNTSPVGATRSTPVGQTNLEPNQSVKAKISNKYQRWLRMRYRILNQWNQDSQDSQDSQGTSL